MQINLNSSQSSRLSYLVLANALLVLALGRVAGVMLIFSLLDAVSLWPLPSWPVEIPGSTRGWQAAHVGGILNGVLVVAGALLMQKLELIGLRAFWVGWGLLVTGWGNTLFYWAGNFAANRGLSVMRTPFGEGDLAGALAYFGGAVAMLFTFIAVGILAKAAFDKAASA